MRPLALLVALLALPGCCASGSPIAPEPSADASAQPASMRPAEASARPASMRRPDPAPAVVAAPDITPEQAIALVLATDEARATLAQQPSYEAHITRTKAAYYQLELSPAVPDETGSFHASYRVERPSGRVLFSSVCQDQNYMDRDWMAFEDEAMSRIAALPEVRGYAAMLDRLSKGTVWMTMYAEQCTQAAPGSGHPDTIGVYVGERHESHTVRGFGFEVERSHFAITVNRVTEPMSVPYATWRTMPEAADHRRELARAPGKKPR